MTAKKDKHPKTSLVYTSGKKSTKRSKLKQAQAEIKAYKTQVKYLEEMNRGLSALSQEITDRLSGNLQTARRLLVTLVDRLDFVHEDPIYKGVWTNYHVHGGTYVGPTYTKELDAARAYARPAVIPNPGSQEALNLGCACPVLDNNYGHGDGPFWINETCTLHTVLPKIQEPRRAKKASKKKK